MMLKNNVNFPSLVQSPQKIASILLDNRVVLSKAVVIIASVIAVYYSDLGLIFGNALEFTTGNITNYVITIPFMSGYILYRKRNILKAVSTSSRGNNYNRIRLDDIVGVTLCSIAVIIYMAGSATLYALEYHILSLPIFLTGGTILLFNFATFRHAVVAILLTLYLQPPPGQIVSEVAADLSWTSSVIVEGLLGSLGLPISLDSSFGAPALTVESSAGLKTPFFVGEPSSGVFSTIGLSLFAVFVAYIIRGPTWKRILLFASGFPLFYLLNTLRIAMVISLWYLWGEDVSEAYHAISGSSMVAIGTLMILLVGEKAFKLNIRTPRGRSNECNTCSKCLSARESMCLSCGRALGKLKQAFGRSAERIATVIFMGLIATSLIVTSIQVGHATRKLSDLDIRKIEGQETTEYFLPMISGWDLQYAYRDTRVESILNQDAALAYRYTPSSSGATGQTGNVVVGNPSIYSSVQISTGHHVWEDSLVTAPSRVGRPGATLLESEDIAISDDKKGRFLLFKRLGSTSTEAVVYWFERTPLRFGSNFENRNVLLSVWANTDALARTGIISGSDDSASIKNLYLSLAKPIAKYWDEQSVNLSSSNELLYAFVNRNIHLIIIIISIPWALFWIHHEVKRASLSSKMYKLYRQLTSDDKHFIDALLLSNRSTKHSTGDFIAKSYAKISNIQLSDDQLVHKLHLARRSGLLTDVVASSNDESLLVWRMNFKLEEKSNIRDTHITRIKDLSKVFQLKSSKDKDSNSSRPDVTNGHK